MVAVTTLQGLLERRHLVRISRMPATSSTARTGPPAITPVPSGAYSHLAGAEFADHLVGDGGPLQGDLDHVLLGVLNALADGVGDLGGLTKAKTYQAVAVAHDYQRRELEDTAALDRFADTVNGYDPFVKIQFGVDSCQKYSLLL